jgi:hypothetical protein
MVKFQIISVTLMNSHSRVNHSNNRTKATAAIPMAGAIVTAALLLSGLSLIGSFQQPVIAQEQNMTAGNVTAGNVTAGNVTAGNVTAGNVTAGNATNATMAGGGNATNATMAGGGNATNMTTGGGTEGGGILEDIFGGGGGGG